MRRTRREKVASFLHAIDMLLESISIVIESMMDEDDGDSAYLQEQLAKTIGMLCDLGDELEEKIAHLHIMDDSQTGIDRDEALKNVSGAAKKIALLS